MRRREWTVARAEKGSVRESVAASPLHADKSARDTDAAVGFLPVFLCRVRALLAPGNLQAAAGPSLTTQPQSQTVLAGLDASFSVVAGGQTPLFFQWSLNGVNLANNNHIGGATNATLTVSNVV